MTEQHPITPPQWRVVDWYKQAMAMGADVDAIFLEVFRAGADEELEACCEVLENDLHCFVANELRAARRPKPPTLKEQALDLLDRAEWNTMTENLGNEKRFGLDEIEIIRRALEALDD